MYNPICITIKLVLLPALFKANAPPIPASACHRDFLYRWGIPDNKSRVFIGGVFFISVTTENYR